MALTGEREDRFKGAIDREVRRQVAPTTIVWIGALVSMDANGDLVPAADTAAQANKLIGVALETVDNGTGAAAGTPALVMTKGIAILPATGILVVANLFKIIHATADDTVALTSTNGRILGTLILISDNEAHIEVHP